MGRRHASAARLLVVAVAAAQRTCPAVDNDWTIDRFDRFAGAAAAIGCVLDDGEKNPASDCAPKPCLVGPEWDALREEKGLTDLDRGKFFEVLVEMNDWLTSAIQVHLVTILARDMLGYRVRTLHRTDSKFSFERLASGAIAMNPEIWGHASTKLEQFRKYVLSEDPCVLTHFNGVTADQKFYAPTYVASGICESYSAVKTNPKEVRDTVAPRDGATNVTDAMRAQCEINVWPRSECVDGRWLPPVCTKYPYEPGGPSPQCSEILMGSPLWATSWFEAAVRNLGLNYTMLYHPSLRDEILRRYADAENFVFYWYEPDLLLQEIEVNPLSLPQWSERCAKEYDIEPLDSGVACALRPDALIAGINAKVAEKEPDLRHLHETFQWEPGQLEAIISSVGKGQDAANATCNWLKANVETWTQSVAHVPDSSSSSSSSKSDDDSLIIVWVLGSVGAVFFLALVAAAVLRFRAFLLRSRELARERTFLVQEQTHAAIARVQEFQAHFYVVPGDTFVALGALKSHETLQGSVELYPRIRHVREASSRGLVFLFLSHQWLAHAHPDPDGAHYKAMVGAVRAVAEDACVGLDQVRVWVDFVSIPQKNRAEQRLAITSLPSFASCCDYFVVVAPEAIHKETGDACDVSTYRKRAWCRAEISSCWARSNTNDMYFSSPEGLTPFTMLDDATIIDSLDVFGGELTCCRLGHPNGEPCDREALMLPMLGLFCELYRDRHRNSKVDYETIEPHLERLYPRTFEWRCRVVNEEGSVVESVETHPLYGDLIDAAKYALDLATADERDPIFTRPVPDFRPGTHARRRSRKVHAFKHGAKSERNLDVDLLARSVSLEETKTEHSLTKVLTGRDFAES